MQLQQKAIFDLYIAGHSVQDIAHKMGLEYRSVQSNLKMAVSKIDVTKNLEMEMARDLTALEQLFKVFWPIAIGKVTGGAQDGAQGEPSLEHAEFIVKVLDRKSKLLGLDANKRVDIYHIIEQWAEREGLNPEDVIEVVGTLLPAPADR